MTPPAVNPESSGPPPSSVCTSRSLLERARADDSAAWERLVGLYAPLVFGWCRRWGLPEQDAADVLQDVFQAVVAHLAGFRSGREGGTFRGWLRTIAHNKVLDHFRRQGREPRAAGGSDAQQRLAQLPGPEAPGSDVAEPEERGLFLRALGLIRGDFEERTWQAFWSTAVDGRAPRDVADELGMSAGAVRVAKSRVLHRLREELGDLLG
ncbi:MAG TPA: sigma-70 family RNA polymerase sigma factor [Gemmataceae bacterium]|jgi:RNA polymerase sigma-70 factor (ECF subfamily)|nr:sigma-70 family RNA polymerase sigma factor [Gemmataceae bacterium]